MIGRDAVLVFHVSVSGMITSYPFNNPNPCYCNVTTHFPVGDDYETAESIIITLPLNNHVTNNTAALAWEKEFLTIMKVDTSVDSLP